MKTIAITDGTLYYKFLTKWCSIDRWALDNGYVDSCKLHSAILGGVFKGLIALAAASLTLFSAGHSIAFLTVCIMYLTFFDPGILALWPIVACFMLCCVAGIIALSEYLSRKDISLPAPVKETYKAWRDKYCVPVSLVSTQKIDE